MQGEFHSFVSKISQAYFLVAFAELDRELKHYSRAMKSYDEILNSMDSMPELWDIEFYRLSGYAPYAYSITAALGVGRVAKADAQYRKHATELLNSSFDRHPNDAAGLMDSVALHHFGGIKDADYKFKIDVMCSWKPELRKISDTFEKEMRSHK